MINEQPPLTTPDRDNPDWMGFSDLDQNNPLLKEDTTVSSTGMIEDPDYTFTWETEKAKQKRLDRERKLKEEAEALKKHMESLEALRKSFDFVSSLPADLVEKELSKTPRYLNRGKKSAKSRIKNKKRREISARGGRRRRATRLYAKWNNLRRTYNRRKIYCERYDQTGDIFEFYPRKRGLVKNPLKTLGIPKFYKLNNDFLLTFEEYEYIHSVIEERYGFTVQDNGVGTPTTERAKTVNYAPVKMGRIIKTQPFELGNIEFYYCVGSDEKERQKYVIDGLSTPNGLTIPVREYTKPFKEKWSVPDDADTWGKGYLTLYRERLVLLRI